MPILERYRRQPAGPSSSRLLLVLSALLVAVVLAFTSLSDAGRKKESVASQHETPAPDTALSVVVDTSVDTAVATYVWEALDEDEERRMLVGLQEQGPLFLREHREAYYYMLNKVHRMSETDLDYELDPHITYEDFRTRPGIIRGAVVELAGTLIRFERTDLNVSRSGLPAVWQGNLVDRSGRPVVVALTEAPEAPFVVGRVDTQNTLEVTVRGVFLQNVQYENLAGETIAAPLIIARGLTPAVGSSQSVDGAKSSWLWIALACAAGALLVWRLWRTYHDIRTRPARRVHADLPDDLE